MSAAAFRPDRWRRIEELFHASLDLVEPQRAAFLRESCGADDQLRIEVESLLANDYQESLITGIVDDATARMLEEDCPPPQEPR